jgi:hypothetical protein
MGAGLRDIAPKEVYYAKIDWSTTDDGTEKQLVAGVAGKRIEVISFFYSSSSASYNSKFTSGPADSTGDQTDLTGIILVIANGVVKGGWNPDAHFRTVAGEDLTFIRSHTSLNLAGWITYILA